MFDKICLPLFSRCAFCLGELLFCFWFIIVYPGFISSYAYWEEVLVVSDFIELHGKYTCATSSADRWTAKAQTSQTSVVSLSPPLQFTGMFHARDLTCQWSLKWYFVRLWWWLFYLHMFISVTCDETNWLVTIFNWCFPIVVLKKNTLRSSIFPMALSHSNFRAIWV